VAVKQIYVQRPFLEEVEEEVKRLREINSDHVVKIV
jgi:hypothetical protein